MGRPIQVGDCVAKEDWTQCAVKVLDKGQIYFVGHLFDYKEGRRVNDEFVGRLDDCEWRRVEVISAPLLSVN